MVGYKLNVKNKSICAMVMTWGGGSGWLQAIMELVDHFHRQGCDVPANKDSRCCGRMNKTGQMAAFGYCITAPLCALYQFLTVSNMSFP